VDWAEEKRAPGAQACQQGTPSPPADSWDLPDFDLFEDDETELTRRANETHQHLGDLVYSEYQVRQAAPSPPMGGEAPAHSGGEAPARSGGEAPARSGDEASPSPTPGSTEAPVPPAEPAQAVRPASEGRIAALDALSAPMPDEQPLPESLAAPQGSRRRETQPRLPPEAQGTSAPSGLPAPPARSASVDPDAAPEADADNEEGSTHVWSFGQQASGGRRWARAADLIAKRYRILDTLGEGGMARIYRAEHVSLGKEFALKIMAAELSENPVLRKNFIREAKVASQMDHPHIVQVTDFGVDDDCGAYLVMELLKGETLRSRLVRERRLRLQLALETALQVAEALHYMHEQDIIHCDIKAENVFLCELREKRRREAVKLIDFGLSKTQVMGARLARSELGGTPHYMSPEQFAGLAPQPSMDIYALGVLLYEMIVGELPFDGDVQQLMAAHLRETPIPPSKRYDQDLDERVDQLVVKALAKEPEQRQPTMGQLIYELRTLMDMLGFGRKRARRKAMEASPVPRVDEGRLVFENSPCPQFRIDAELRIVVANQACAKFFGAAPEELVGRPLDATKICFVYPSLRMDVMTAIDQRTDLQQLLTIQKDPQRTAHLLFWLVQERDESTGDVTFSGLIIPQSAPGAG
jgi:tRNA A-37 threonylcarbamoyl transferase component Bud32